jgi:PAS domain S-box-containing protein
MMRARVDSSPGADGAPVASLCTLAYRRQTSPVPTLNLFFKQVLAKGYSDCQVCRRQAAVGAEVSHDAGANDGDDSLKTDHKLVAYFSIATLLTASVAALSFWAYSQIGISAYERKQSFALINGANILLEDMASAESGQRGYSLTGQTAFLQPYLAARDRIPGQIDKLRTYSLHTDVQKHLDVIASLVAAKLAHMAHLIELRRGAEIGAVLAAEADGEGKRIMDALQAEIQNVDQIQEAAYARHDREFQSSLRALFVLIISASLLALLFAFVFAWMILRETQHRLKDLLHVETRHLLDQQEETNRLLQRANATLEISEEKLAITLNSIGDAVIATDADGRVTLLNPLAARLTGWTQAEASGRAVEDIFHIVNPDTRQPAHVPVMDTLARGTLHGLANHTVLIARDGTECTIADSCAPIRTRAGLVVGAVLVFRDITERALLEQVVHEKNTELEIAVAVADRANQAKSDFLSSMSHELRTPLSAILGFAQLMESASPQPTASQKRSLEQILKAGWYLLDLINEILDLALIESGKLSLSLEPVSISEVMHECEAMIEPQAQKRRISMTLPRHGNSVFVKADRTRIKQVLLNLLSNAVKYNKVGGAVDVEFVTHIPGRIRVCVKDTGEGLGQDQLAQLFQPFNRLGKEGNGEAGTGIGLVVCKRLVELMGGLIGAESSRGKGSVFWIEFNLVHQPESISVTSPNAHWKPAQVHVGAPAYTLLYVEDNPANLMLVEDIIARRPDIRLLSAMDAIHGIELALSSKPDAILMDINLPGISGVEALRILGEDTATSHIPVIALSANALPSDVQKGMDAGFFRYLTKPIKVKEFMETLDAVLQFSMTQKPHDNILDQTR